MFNNKLLMSIIIFFFVWNSSSYADQVRGRDGKLKVLSWQAVSTLNPYLSGGGKDMDAASLVLEPLARYNNNGELIPVLAEEIPTLENGGLSADLRSITWKIKKDIVWSDGTPLTADDVVFTGRYCLHSEAGCVAISRFEGVKNLETVDAHTLKINFSIPKPYPYSPLVGAGSPILQKAQFAGCLGMQAQTCTDQNFFPIGTGPFKVTEFHTNDVVSFAANDNYRKKGLPAFSDLVIKGGGDAVSAARAVLVTGEYHYAGNIQIRPELLNQMETHGRGKIAATFGPWVEQLVINLTNPNPDLGDDRSLYKGGANPHPFLSDPSVRRALSLAIDRQILVEAGYGAAGKPVCNILPVHTSKPNNSCLNQNISLANAILDKAGWVPGEDGVRSKNGVRLSLLYQTSTNAVRQDTQLLVKHMWEQIGVEVELVNIDSAVFFGSDPASPHTYGKFYADIQMYSHGSGAPDSESFVSIFQCDKIPSPENGWLGSNTPRYCNPDYDKLVREMVQTVSITKRAELAQKMSDMLVQEGVIIPLVWRSSPSAHSINLKGIVENPWESPFWNIEDWYFE